MAVNDFLQNNNFANRQEYLKGLELVPQNISQPIQYNTSFFSDVADEFLLTALGQALNTNRSYNGYKDLPVDPEYMSLDPEMLKGYEGYESFFLDTRNKEHFEFKKSIIDRNLSARNRLANSDRIFMPALVAGLADPVNYIPIPLFKGVSFFRRAVKGGTFTAGTVALTEPIRRELDPTATDLESALYIGGSFMLGGALTGAFGRSTPKSIIAKETLGNKGGIKKIEENYFVAHSETEGRVNFEAQQFKYNVQDDFFEGVVVNNPNAKELVKYYGPKSAMAKNGKPTLVINEAKIRRRVEDNKHTVHPLRGVMPIAKEVFKSPDDYTSFLMKEELLKSWFKVKKLPNETTADYTNRIRTQALTELTQDVTVDLSTENNFVTRTLEKFTPHGKILDMSRKMGPALAKRMLRLSGDHGVVSRARQEQIALPSSALLESYTNWNSVLRLNIVNRQNFFVEYRVGESVPETTLDFNKQFAALKGRDAVRKVTSKMTGRNQSDPTKLTYEQFNDQVHDAVVDDRIYNDPALHPTIKKAADNERAFYARYQTELKDAGMFINATTLTARRDILQEQLLNYQNGFKKLKSPTAIQKREFDNLINDLKQDVRYLNKQLKDIQADDNALKEFDQNPNYLPRIWRRDKLIKDKEAFINIVADWFKQDPFYKVKPLDVRKKQAEKVYNKIMDEDSLDPEGITGRAKLADGRIATGGKPLLSRSLNIPTSLIRDFVETNVDYLARTYHMRISRALEIHKKFGDHHMKSEMNDIRFEFITQELRSEKDITNMNSVLNAFEDEKDKMLGSISLQDPSSVSRRTAAFLRDWASLAFMGRVLLSAIVDAGRPIMVNGLDATYNDGFKQWSGNMKAFKQASSNVKNYMGVATDLVLGNTRRRVIEDGGFVGRGSSWIGTQADKVSDLFNNLQAPFYMLNGLTPWTQMMKEFTGVMSAHRTLEDSIKWSKGTLDQAGIDRLVGYGIDKKTADLIARMPYEDFDGLLTANTDMWGTRTGGTQASRAFKNAVFADVERTIITPTVTDRPTLMDGVIRINSETKAELMNNKFFRAFGFQKTERGGKISNAFVGLPFQFMAWSFAANRKLLSSGLSGREQNFVGGIIAMVSLGMLSDYLKNPDYWERKTTEEKIIRGIEQSGVTTIFTDVNLIMETLSGAMGTPVGVRPMFGARPLFGDPNLGDAVGGFAGAGPSIPIDLIYAFATDQTFDSRAATVRRIIPYNSLLWTDGLFKSIYNNAVDLIRPEDEIQ